MELESAFLVRKFGHLVELGDLVAKLLVLLEQLLSKLLAFFKDLEELFDLF